MIKKLYKIFLDLFFPKKCVNCGKGKDFMCEDCFSIIEVLENDYCPFCFPPKITTGGRVCPSCKKDHFLDGLICASSLENIVVKKTIHLFKYPPFLKELSRHLSFLIINHLKLTNNEFKFRNFIITPIPIAKKRLSFRGFNQSEEIAKELSSFLNLPMEKIICRIKNTKPQTTLGKDQRQNNVLNAFAIEKKFQGKIKGRNILLIDDVLTTGATINESARILKESGAKSVWGAVVARE